MIEKFTPGPWKAHHGAYEPDYVFYGEDENCDTEKRVIAEVYQRVGFRSYDVDLIAAAPEMFKELERLSALFRKNSIYLDEREKIENILRKARGESEVSDDCDAPWKVDKVDFKSDIFGVGSTILRIFDKNKELITIHIPDEKTANRLARLPELYDALMEAAKEYCKGADLGCPEKRCALAMDHMCKALPWIELLRKVRDGE